MFNSLEGFSKKRTSKEAVAFSFVYLLLGLFLAGLCGYVFSLISSSVNNLSSTIGIYFGVFYSLCLYFLIYTKKQMKSIPFLLLGFITAIIAYYLGIIIPLIIIGILTTKDGPQERKEKLIID